MKSILFSTPMVKAILDDRKNQTRRVIKPQPQRFFEVCDTLGSFYLYDVEWNLGRIYPKYQVGDVLYVRETWKCVKYDSMDGNLAYGVEFKDGEQNFFEFDDNERFHQFGKFAIKKGWQSSLFMPREAARIFPKVTNVRVERLQDITEEDARNEGVQDPYEYQLPKYYEQPCFRGVEINKCAYAGLWDTLYAKRDGGIYAWEKNPWVFVYEFERVKVK